MTRTSLDQGLQWLQREAGAKLTDAARPLIVSVRSGAAVSMPGMLETVLDVGVTDAVVEALDEAPFRWDLDLRRLLTLARLEGLEDDAEARVRAHRARHDLDPQTPFDDTTKRALAAELSELLGAPTTRTDARAQLEAAVASVMASWDAPRARAYRERHRLDELGGTAVIVQVMVFGNRDESSGTGVAFSRDPSSGEARFFGEYLAVAQGDDVVSGARTPDPLEGATGMSARVPAAYRALIDAKNALEDKFRDMVDVEFTVQSGRLWLLQARPGRRSPSASVRVAVDLAREGRIDKDEAILRVEPDHVEKLLSAGIEEVCEPSGVRGLPACPGKVSGRLVVDPREAERRAEVESIILVREETSPRDVPTIQKVHGLLTSRGGMTSHAAVVARGLGTPCVVGCRALRVDERSGAIFLGGQRLDRDAVVTLDGATGQVHLGVVESVRRPNDPALEELMGWADDRRRLGVRVQSASIPEIRAAIGQGAKGVGLCRSERLFDDDDHRLLLQAFLLSEGDSGRHEAAQRVEAHERARWAELFAAADGHPVVARLLDPDPARLIPKTPEGVAQVAERLGRDPTAVQRKVERLVEANPELGLRGCRLGVIHPELYAAQVRAIVRGAAEIEAGGTQTQVELLLPLVCTAREAQWLRARIREVLTWGPSVPVRVGVMIEVPRAALIAADLARDVDFFVFGLRDLTQLTFGVAQADDAFLPHYISEGLVDADPFRTMDRDGVGQLIELAARRGRDVKPELELSLVLGAGADMGALALAEALDMSYVTCAPNQVHMTRLACARAAIMERRAR